MIKSVDSEKSVLKMTSSMGWNMNAQAHTNRPASKWATTRDTWRRGEYMTQCIELDTHELLFEGFQIINSSWNFNRELQESGITGLCRQN